MIEGREEFTITTNMDGESIDKLYTKELIPTPPEEFEKLSDEEKKLHKPYPFDPHTYEAAPGIICEQDVGVEMRDGVVLYADIFRPADDSEKVPAILAWSNYGKRPNEYRPPELVAYTPGVPAGSVSPMAKFEAPDPAFWVPNGYAVINVDIRGIGYSGGYHEQFGKQDAEDGYDFIEWCAKQDWCNGKVAMSGSSALAISQWHIAAEQPPHLACIAPWEGMSDMYRESLCEGGIPCVKFTNFATAGACGLKGIDDQGGMAEKYPLMNAYWRDKIPDFSKVTVPAYVTAGWNHFHLRGSVIGWRKISSKQKWLRCHREFEWPDYYSRQYLPDLKAFFDRYCKDIHNGWESTPRVRISVQDRFDEDWQVDRHEEDFPIPRTRYEKLYLDAGNMKMSSTPISRIAETSYDSQTGEADFDYTFDKDTELTGYMRLRLWVEARGHDDMDLFVTIKKLSRSGIEQPVTIFDGTAPHPGAWGKMRVSHRELDPELSTDFEPVQSHERELKLSPGEIVPIDVEINPTSRIWHAGETLRIQVAGRYIRDPHWIEPLIWETDNAGEHVIHTGGDYDSWLQIPVIPPKYDDDTVFVVNEEKHPSHPIF
ncbi:MAG: CocE/NonD family hydrolase [Coriobacteriales bacterium]|jgi:predicted acyl esterase